MPIDPNALKRSQQVQYLLKDDWMVEAVNIRESPLFVVMSRPLQPLTQDSIARTVEAVRSRISAIGWQVVGWERTTDGLKIDLAYEGGP